MDQFQVPMLALGTWNVGKETKLLHKAKYSWAQLNAQLGLLNQSGVALGERQQARVGILGSPWLAACMLVCLFFSRW